MNLGFQKREAVRRPLRTVLVSITLLIFAIPAYNAYAQYRLDREIAAQDRDPSTGIIRGAEALTLPAAERSASASENAIGSGPKSGEETSAVLLIHGYAGSRRDFNDLGERLQSAGHTVRYVRLPGHGTTAREFAAQEDSDFLEHVRGEYRALRRQHDQVSVGGFSMGGALATILAGTEPEPPDALILIGPYYDVPHRWYYLLPPRTWHRLLRDRVPYAVKSDYFIKTNKHQNRKHMLSYRVVPSKGTDAALALADLAASSEVLEGIRSPVLVVHGAKDDAADPVASREAFEGMVNAASKEFISFPRSNHILLWDWDGEEAADAIVGFLATSF